ncbi:MAG: sigma-54 dependent transcriptional regulator [Proteobacteria bacterium]|nr:sigma-54 dependent transcriptional regulator [Pseudomonadota bacterium]MBU4469907.1 sigma-54 dependent transcriptional regulator [Pseudomonadota bacterium]MCG2751593.1 sigma-54 dependent transcriptional regulator [Desulfobacteraceae bacterium]
MLIRLVLAVKNKDIRNTLEKHFSQTDVRMESFGHLKTAWQKVVRSCADIIVISESFILSPLESGLAYINNLPENPTTVILHETDSSEEQARITAAGADVVLYTGISKKNLVEALEATIEARRQFIQKEWIGNKGSIPPKTSDFVFQSETMRIFVDEVQQIVSSDSPILLTGETGVGKEHLARAIHAESHRSKGPFITVNTAAVPEQLLESELFGHEQGSFTGATRYRRGAFELAHGGTIFLDEIGEMPRQSQAKLLRILQDFEVRPLGSETSFWVDTRVIVATNRDLEKEINRGDFRNDLYYRISVITLTIPPLRYRKEDIPSLSRRFLTYYRHRVGREVNRFSEEALQAISRYNWPGNVRELMNVIERAMLLCRSEEITLMDLPDIFRKGIDSTGTEPAGGTFLFADWENQTLSEVLGSMTENIEKKYLEMVLRQTGGRIGKAAKISGLNPRGLYNKMKRLNLQKETFKKS